MRTHRYLLLLALCPSVALLLLAGLAGLRPAPARALVATTTTLTAAPNPSTAGQLVTLTATVSCPGNTPTGSVSFFDGMTFLGSRSLVNSVASMSLSNLNAGSHTLTATYAGAGNCDTSTSAPVTQMVNQASTTMAVTATPNPVLAGQPETLTATVSVVAPGGGTPTGSVSFFDGATFLGSRNLVGVVATLTTSFVIPGQHTLVAVYTGDNNYFSVAGTTTLTVIPAADLSVTKTGPATVTAGTPITYTLVVSNSGPNDAENVALTDTLPAGETFLSASEGSGSGTSYSDNIGTLANGATRTITLMAMVSPSQPVGAVTNSASVSSTTADPTPGNNTTTFNTAVQTSADVQITKSGPATAFAGTDVTYHITTTNAGPSDAQAVSTTDTLPANTTLVSFTQDSGPANGGTLPAGTTQTYTVVLHTDPATVNGTVITNTAQVSSTTADPNTANNTATATTTVTVPSLMSCSASPTVLSPADGTMRNVTVTVSSSGSYTLQSVTSNDPSFNAATDSTFVIGTTYLSSQTTVSGSLRASVGPGLHGRLYVLTFVPVGPAVGTSCQVTVQVRLR